VRRVIIVLASAAFVASVYFANWLVNRYGPINVWPTALMAPAGVYVVGLAFLLRDTIQRFAGQRLAILLIAIGTGLSVFVSPKLALASAAAFAASEITGLGIFWLGGGNTGGTSRLGLAVIASSVAAAAIDSYIFLQIAFGSLAFFGGQFVAKIMVTAIAIPFVLIARKRWPANDAEAAEVPAAA
jgi:uncharacterized PurR-regulated membrane protein YhhQ (DUF165 family)